MSSDERLQRPLIEVTGQPIWQLVRSIREQVHSALEDYPSDLRSAAVMTASELVENAVKYGDGAAGSAPIRFSLGVSAGVVWIRVTNCCSNQLGVDELLIRVDEIKRTADKEGLYLQRIAQVLSRPEEGGNFGLYRIALEGGFALDCSVEERTVSVSATRKIQ